VKIIGHRGARGLAPENTLAAFAKAIELEVDGVEFDVRVTKDKIPILHHGKYMHLPVAPLRRIRKSDLKELKALKADLTTLEEALKYVGLKCQMYVEIKPGEDIGPIVSALKAYSSKGRRIENLAVASFDQNILRQVRRQLPDIALIVNERWSGVRARLRARQVGTRIISMNHLGLWSGFISAMHRSGYSLYTYTLNDPAKAERWAKRGLAGVVTDYPDRFKRFTR
jgi:glycerophosphoryl diester phosphodiesterase